MPSRPLRPVMRSLSKKDITLATSQLATVPPGPQRDAGIVGILEATFSAEPASSMHWALAITDPEIRDAHAIDQLSAWANMSATNAQSWLEQEPNLDPALREEMRTIIDQALAIPTRSSRSVTYFRLR